MPPVDVLPRCLLRLCHPSGLNTIMSKHSTWNRLWKPFSFSSHSNPLLISEPTPFSRAKAIINSRSLCTTHSDSGRTEKRLAGQICMITGGTSGIGFAIAKRFLQEGAASLILVGRSQERLASAAASLRTFLDNNHSIENTSHDPGILSPDKIQLIVGDVAEPGPWLPELERNMVSSLRHSCSMRR